MKDRNLVIVITISSLLLLVICSLLAASNEISNSDAAHFDPTLGLIEGLVLFSIIIGSGILGLASALFVVLRYQKKLQERSPWMLTLAIILCFNVGFIYSVITYSILGANII